MSWRVLWSGHADGYTNMAVDEALMWAARDASSPPTLRLYGWQPAAVSLGYFQDVEGEVDRDELAARGWDLVRRPTGGRAILHDDELTYSFTIPETSLAHGSSVMGSYREISRGIELALQALGLQAELAAGATDEQHRAASKQLPTVCFAQASRCDMVAAGLKVVGSAQVRKEGIILQHGSVPLHLHLDDQIAVMPGPQDRPETTDHLAQVARGIADLVDYSLTFDDLAHAMVQGFSAHFGVDFTPGDLTPAEATRAAELREDKYATDDWNLTRPRRRSLAR